MLTPQISRYNEVLDTNQRQEEYDKVNDMVKAFGDLIEVLDHPEHIYYDHENYRRLKYLITRWKEIKV